MDFYKSIIESSPAGYAYHKIILDENNTPCDYEFIEVNIAFENFTGLKRLDILGKNISEVLPDIKKSEFNWIKFYGNIAISDGNEEFEQFSEVLNRWYKAKVYSPEKYYFITHFTDITKEKSQIDELQKSKYSLANILEGTNVGTWEWNVQTGKTVYDERWAEIIGYTLEEISPVSIETWTRLVHIEDLSKSEAQLKQVFDKEIDYYDIECRMKHKDGSLIWVQDRGKVTSWTADGKPLMMSGTHTDITERKQVEKFLLESQRIAHLGTWRLDLATNHVVWSEELYKMYRFDPTLPPPPYTEHMKLFTPESWDRLATSLDYTRTSGIPYELELETVTIDGSNGWMWVRGEAEMDSEGNIISLWGAAQDITERKRAEEALHESKQFLRSTLDGLSSHIAVINEGGEIVLTNKAYRDFAKRNKIEHSTVSEGCNYLPVDLHIILSTKFQNILSCK